MENNYSEDEFIQDIFQEVLLPEVVSIISDYVEETYTVNLDEETKKTKNALIS